MIENVFEVVRSFFVYLLVYVLHVCVYVNSGKVSFLNHVVDINHVELILK